MNLEMKSWWNEEFHLNDNFQTNPQMNISNQGERRLSYKYRNHKVVEEKSRRVECQSQNQILLFPFCIFLKYN